MRYTPPDRLGRAEAVQRQLASFKTAYDESGELCRLSLSYEKPTSIAHWQLRDLLSCPRHASELFSVFRHRILRHDLTTCRTSTVSELSFEPTSVAVAHGHSAAGGHTGQLDLRRLGGWSAAAGAGGSGLLDGGPERAVFRGHCGGSVINALKLARDASSELRLFASNNDETIKIFALDTGAMLGLVRAPCAINYCALSPDGQHLVAVGDSRNVYVYQATPTGYRSLRVLTEATDAGMGCDWAPSGSCYAAAFQDGVAAMWDHRSGLIARYRTPLACRSIKFSPSPLDLLAFAEHRARVHVVDQRMWGRLQVVHVGYIPEMEPDIAGMTFSPCGSRLHVATEDAITTFEVDTASRRCFAAAEIC